MVHHQNTKIWHSCEDHDYKSCQMAANCYSYILDEPNYYWAVPGHGYYKGAAQEFFDKFNEYFSDYSPEQFQDSLKQGAILDGLQSVDEPVLKKGYYLAVLLFTDTPSNYDFHWLRLEEDGLWSHKNGWHSVSGLDESGRDITDPLVMKNSQYPIFGGYYLVPDGGLALNNSFSADYILTE